MVFLSKHVIAEYYTTHLYWSFNSSLIHQSIYCHPNKEIVAEIHAMTQIRHYNQIQSHRTDKFRPFSLSNPILLLYVILYSTPTMLLFPLSHMMLFTSQFRVHNGWMHSWPQSLCLFIGYKTCRIYLRFFKVL